MPGMIGGRGAAGLAIVAEFKSAVLAEGTFLFLVFVLLAVCWTACREVLLARARSWLAAQRGRWPREPAWRRVLRIGFGVLWLIDGLLQAQPLMAVGLPSQVIDPAAGGSEPWVIRLVDWGTRSWFGHPAQAAVSVMWIQIGIGMWLICGSSPRWSRLAGLVSAGWGLVVWVFGEAFGSMFAPGASWLTGAPGAAVFYITAGALLALPPRYWRDRRLGMWLLRAFGVLLLGFALLQAWPGRGFWQGTVPGPRGSAQPGPLSASISSMAAGSQPAALHDLLSWFAGVAARYGFAINLIAVVAIAAAGLSLLTAKPAIARLAAGAFFGFCLATWVLVQDCGVFGGTGTDPNSMLPQMLVITAGLLAAAAGLEPAGVTAPAPLASAAASVQQAEARGPVPPAEGAPVPPAEGAPAQPAEGAPAQPAEGAPAQPAEGAPAQPGGPAAPTPPVATTPGPRPGLLRTLLLPTLLWPWQATRALARAFGTANASGVLAVWAVAIVLMGALPLAMAAITR